MSSCFPSRTKTRMMPHLTPKQCELLHTCFLEDIRKECETCSADVFVYYTLEKNINEPTDIVKIS